MEHHSAVRRNELWINTTTWMNLKMIMLRERSQAKQYMLCENANCLQREKADQRWPGERGRRRREGLKSGGATWLKSHQ